MKLNANTYNKWIYSQQIHISILYVRQNFKLFERNLLKKTPFKYTTMGIELNLCILQDIMLEIYAKVKAC